VFFAEKANGFFVAFILTVSHVILLQFQSFFWRISPVLHLAGRPIHLQALRDETASGCCKPYGTPVLTADRRIRTRANQAS
jgi:hypothetical protein